MFHNMQKRRWRGYAKIPYHQCHNVFLTWYRKKYLLHLNTGNLKSRLKDIEVDTIMKSAYIISLNETHFGENDTLTSKMMGIKENESIFQHDHSNSGGGIALIIYKNSCLKNLH